MFRVLIGAFALVTVTACGGNAGSNIPIDGVGGSGGEGGTPSCGLVCDSFGDDQLVEVCDQYCSPVVCSLTGVEECAPECEVCEICEDCEICEPEVVTVYLCKTLVKVCPKTFCSKTFGHCECSYEWQWQECDGPDQD